MSEAEALGWFFSRGEEKAHLNQISSHCSVLSVREEISDLFGKMAALQIKFYQVGEEEKDLLKPIC